MTLKDKIVIIIILKIILKHTLVTDLAVWYLKTMNLKLFISNRENNTSSSSSKLTDRIMKVVFILIQQDLKTIRVNI